MVANDLCIKAKNRCGSVKQSSFQRFGVFRATRHFYTSNRGFAVTSVGSHVVLLGYTVRMFEYTVRTFRSNVGRFLYVFSSIPRKLYTIFQPTFPLSNATRIASLSFLL